MGKISKKKLPGGQLKSVFPVRLVILTFKKTRRFREREKL